MTMIINREPWQQDALCAQIGGDLWHPEQGDNRTVRQAKELCALCPVIGECLEYALEHRERFGVWGGMSERQRRGLERARRAA